MIACAALKHTHAAPVDSPPGGASAVVGGFATEVGERAPAGSLSMLPGRMRRGRGPQAEARRARAFFQVAVMAVGAAQVVAIGPGVASLQQLLVHDAIVGMHDGHHAFVAILGNRFELYGLVDQSLL